MVFESRGQSWGSGPNYFAALLVAVLGGLFAPLLQAEESHDKPETTPAPSYWDVLREKGRSAAGSLQQLAGQARPAGEKLVEQARQIGEQVGEVIGEKNEAWREFLISPPGEEDSNAVTEEDSPPPIPPGQKPESYSLRPVYQELGLDVKNQGRRGSCTIFGTLGVIEFHYARRGQHLRLSEQFAAWAAAKAHGNSQKMESYSSRDLIKGIKEYGICTEDLMPYDPRKIGRPSREALADAAGRRSISETIFQRYRENRRGKGFTDQTLNAICWSLYEGHPVSASVEWYEKPKLDDGGNIKWSLRDPPRSRHMIVLVGYEMDPKWPGGGRMEIRNSWGEDWGRDGYAWVDFEYLKRFGQEAFAIKAF